ncbi:FHA domain-containing protein [Paraliomyxa miuraensis]|uniref:FHA domain-containing protein n=1 Tax=Paraliomyxa miuraensis TaxID=376150 RepID=UPI00224F15DF|nr:FHA domain-containing protein [Paraliomyxa miuraensis]MCX4246958.1 FHA domain-containing protein [Paraliomyxa miuraensis]
MIRISIAEAGKSPQLLTFNASAITLGRASQHELPLTGKGVSSTHCRILREGEAYFVEDLGSTNGTYVNRQRVHGRQAIGPQDEVVLAVYRLRVLVDAESGAMRMPSAAVPMATPMGYAPPPMGASGASPVMPLHASGPSLPSSSPSLPSSSPSFAGSGPSLPGSGPSLPGSGPSLAGSGPSGAMGLAAGSGAVPVMGPSGRSQITPSSADMAWGREWEQIDKLANAWLASGKGADHLLRGEKLAHARKWLAQGRGKQPPPKPLHRDFILSGARARMLRGLGGTMVGAVVLGGVGTGIFFAVQPTESTGGDGEQTAKLDVGSGSGPVEVVDPRSAEASAELATRASGEGDPVVAVLLAAEATKRLPPESATPDALAFEVLRATLRDLPGRPLRGPGGEGHLGPVERVALSPDGHWAITAGNGGGTGGGNDVYLWNLDAAGVIEPKSLAGHPRGLTGMAVSEDGRWLVTADADGLAMRWNLLDRDPAATSVRLEDHRAPISALDLSANGRWLVTGDESGQVKVWDLDMPSPSASTLPRGHEGKVTGVAINATGNRVVSSGEDMTARNWRVVDSRGKNPVVVLHEEVVVTAVGLAPDDQWAVSGGADGVVRLWPPTSTVPTRKWELLSGHKGVVSTIDVSADSSMAVSVAQDKDLWIWDLHAKVPSASSVRLSGHTARIHQLALYSPPPGLAPTRRVPATAFTASEDGTARSWDLDQRKVGAFSRVFSGHRGGIRSVGVSGDGQWAITGGADRVARVWDWQSMPVSSEAEEGLPRLGSASKVGRGHTQPVVAVAVDPFGRRMITGSADGTTRIWDMRHPTRLRSLPLSDVHTDRVRAVATSTDGQMAVSGDNAGRLVLWDIQAESPSSRTLMGHSGEIGMVEFTPDSKRLISVSTDRTARVWTMGDDPESSAAVLSHDDEVIVLAVSGDGRWLLTGTLTEAVLWNLNGSLESPERTFKGHEDDLKTVALSANGRWAATGANDRKILLYDLDKGKLAGKLRGHEGVAGVLSFSPDGRRLASGADDRSIRLWDLTSDHPDEGSLELTGHSGGISDFEWSPDGRWLISSSNDGTIRLWDTRKDPVDMMETAVVLEGHSNLIPSLALVTKEGRMTHVVSVSYDGTARLWPFEVDDSISLACTAAGRRLTEDEWKELVGGKYRTACD